MATPTDAGTGGSGSGSISAAAFKRAMAELAGGVVIVTTRDEEGSPRGMTATAVCSVSVRPPLVMVCMAQASATHGGVEDSGVFALNVLAHDARELAARFGSRAEDKFADVEYSTGETGAPLLTAALARCDCRVERSTAAGDHTIFVGRVLAADSRDDDADPLLYFRGRYRSLGPISPAPGRRSSP